MRTEKAKAIKLRLAGKSYTEIGNILHVPRATLSSWLRTLPLSPAAKHRILQKKQNSKAVLQTANTRRSTEAAQRAYEMRAAGLQTIGQLSFRDLLIAGAMLYWAEGYKKPIFQAGKTRTYHSVRITTGDPEIVGLFSRFLRIVCGVRASDIRINLRIDSPSDTGRYAVLFARNANIPLSRIKATVRKPSSHTSPIKAVVAELVVNNTALYHTIMGFIDGLAHAR